MLDRAEEASADSTEKYGKRAPALGHGCPDPVKAKDLAMDGLILRRPWMVESSAGRERKAQRRRWGVINGLSYSPISEWPCSNSHCIPY
jgi:hypothetical protein